MRDIGNLDFSVNMMTYYFLQFSPDVVCYGAGAGHSFSQAVGKSVANPG